MSIEKKSLISNRKATKKAIVTKPEIAAVAPAKLVRPSAIQAVRANLSKTSVSRANVMPTQVSTRNI